MPAPRSFSHQRVLTPFLSRAYDWIGVNEKPVAVPHKLFKIVIKESDNPNRPEVLAFIYNNHPSLNDKSLSVDHTPFLKPVDEIEELTGLVFCVSAGGRSGCN